MKKDVNIYQIKLNDKIYYIGKTNRNDKNGNIRRSMLTYGYTNKKIIDLFNNKDIKIEKIVDINHEYWFDRKLSEVVKSHKAEHPLLNAQWMLDGKRSISYWEGRKRDSHTIKRLSESKFKQIAQYDINGNLIKVWDSVKESAICFVGDYTVDEETKACKTKLYNLLRNKKVNNRLLLDCYWFLKEELISKYGNVPEFINIPEIKNAYSRTLSDKLSNRKYKYKTKYTVIQYDNDGNIINSYLNVLECANSLGISISVVNRYCNGINNKRPKFHLKYGEKVSQLIN